MYIRAQEKRPFFLLISAMTLMALILVVGGFSVHSLVAESFYNINRIDATAQTGAGLLRVLLDEETGIRGAAAAESPIFLEPYTLAVRRFPPFRSQLNVQLAALGELDAQRALADLTRAHSLWESEIAARILRDVLSLNRPHSRQTNLELQGKLLFDHIRADFNLIDRALNARRDLTIRQTRRSIDTISTFILLCVIGFAIVCTLILRHLYFLLRRLEAARLRERETQSELATKQHIAEILQEALSQRPLPSVPSLRFSATYVPAAEQSKVGGDWYDAIELANNRVIVIVGDVAGHGIDAAVWMSRARQAFIASALKDPDPARVLMNVNAELQAQGSPMVTAVCGLADSESYEFAFAVAGHPPPLLIEPEHRPCLLPCGGLPLGIMPDAQYQTRTVQTVPSAMLVLYTDGAIEHSHDVIEGELLLIEAAERCRNVASEYAMEIHRTIFEGRVAGDDVAILTLGFTSELQTGKSSVDPLQTSFSDRAQHFSTRFSID
jgi:hypothetical protein